jgi:3-oxoisoapionate decarboxylase
MNRRDFLLTTAGAAALPLAAAPATFPMGLNTYCLRSLRWQDAQLLEYAANQQMDAIFLQDSLDPKVMDAAHWRDVREQAARLGLKLETGGGGIFPKDAAAFDQSVATLRKNIERASAMGSPLVRCVIASQRSALPAVPMEQNVDTVVKLLKTVRSQVMDSALKIAIEVHKDLQAWELKQLIEMAGPEFVGVYLDTGNPPFVMENPQRTLETLGQYALTVHLRDSIIFEHPDGIAVQWVPLGDGIIDFKTYLTRAAQLCPKVTVYIKPITGRLPQVLPVYDRAYWKSFPKARAEEFAEFVQLAKRGRPYEKYMLIEDAPGKPPEILPLVQRQQKEHMEQSIRYGRDQLGLGVRGRSA